MSSRRQRSIPLGGRYRQVSLYLFPTRRGAKKWVPVNNFCDIASWETYLVKSSALCTATWVVVSQNWIYGVCSPLMASVKPNYLHRMAIYDNLHLKTNHGNREKHSNWSKITITLHPRNCSRCCSNVSYSKEQFKKTKYHLTVKFADVIGRIRVARIT